MMKAWKTERSLSTVAALLLFAVFAVLVLAVLLGGARSYRRLSQRDESTYQSRTCTQYLMTKLRQAESPGAIRLAAFGDTDALEITQTVGEDVFSTRIYCYDGWLMELFTAAGGTFSPQDGEQILPAAALTAKMEGDLLRICVTDGSGALRQLCYALGGGEVLP